MEGSAQSRGGLRVHHIERITEVAQEDWDRLAEPLETPFLEWGWLSALEESGSIAPPYGWHPRHVTLWRGSRLVAAAPLYIKEHSDGELIFDFAWADAAYQVGAEYYPKLVGMSPATPSPAYQFLIDSQEDRGEITARLLQEIETLCERELLAGVHFQHIEPRWAGELDTAGYRRWTHQGYEWRNRGFASFEDYLTRFNKNQRRNIRRERASVYDNGILVKTLTAEEIPAELFGTMARYYEAHNAQFGPWAAKFLNRRFFTEVEARYRARLVLVAAYHDEVGAEAHAPGREPIAMSFLVAKGDRLVGRYWGAGDWHDNLHFEVCYYAPIAYAIETGRSSFDPGIGSPHKLRRGFEAVELASLHKFRDPRMQTVFSTNIERINSLQRQQISLMNDHVPFKKQER